MNKNQAMALTSRESVADEPDEPEEPGRMPGANASERELRATREKPAFEIDSGTLSPGEAEWFRTHLIRAVGQLPRPAGLISATVVGDEQMRRLHARHLADHRTTDVMTFDLSDSGEPSSPIDCDIVICIDEARRHASERGWSPVRELLLYAVHGLLHCCGFDDQDEASFARLHAEEDRILEAIGVGATFLRSSEADTGGASG